MIAAAPFELPARLEAAEPPEARGRARDGVRLMVAGGGLPPVHARFPDLAGHLRAGDLLVVNVSATLPAALRAGRCDVHLSTPVPGDPGRWVIELRRDGERMTGGAAGDSLALPGGGSARLVAPYLGRRLWVAELRLPAPLLAYLARHGRPIGYRHLAAPRPLADHQTLFATTPGSAEMPSAARPFTPRVVAALRARGVGIAPVTLHTGVSSLERGEPPYPERFSVPASTIARTAAARRVIAVGTTVVRALETAAGRAAHGWTSRVVTPEDPPRHVDALLTGLHEPEASHLLMLEALAGRSAVEEAYAAALAHGYRWHEFGDVQLLYSPSARRGVRSRGSASSISLVKIRSERL